MLKTAPIIRNLALIALFSASANDLFGQETRSLPFKAGSFLQSGVYGESDKEMQTMIHMSQRRSSAMAKSTSVSERLIAQTTFSSPRPGKPFDDSLLLTYSDTRSSAFDKNSLTYDFLNANDVPNPFKETSYVYFDTAYFYFASGGLTPAVSRTYGPNGKVLSVVDKNTLSLFYYDAQDRVRQRTTVARGGGTFVDTLNRNFYIYNAGGQLLMDSVEEWNQALNYWMASYANVYKYDAAGNATQMLFIGYSGSASTILYQLDAEYNAANLLLSITKRRHLNATLVNEIKDTIGYTGTTRVMGREYKWDGPNSKWDLSYEELRHLNSASLPDSIWIRQIVNGGSTFAVDILKLTYDAHGNPTSRRTYNAQNMAVMSEIHWYYEEPVLKVMAAAAKHDLSIYPNPAGDMLFLKGVSEGRYMIRNMAGAVVLSGTLLPSAGISLSVFVAGVYSVSLQDKNGIVHKAQFIRK
jgi:hypothetical protein